MKLRLCFVVVLVAATISFGQTQTGPRNGAGLPPTDLERVALGNSAPDFTLTDTEGKPVTLSSFRGKKSVVLVFYRGHW